MAGEDSAEDRDEAPTARRLQKARDEGEAARSAEVPAAAVMIGCAAYLIYAGPDVFARLRAHFSAGLSLDPAKAQASTTLPAIFADQLGQAFLIIAPLLAISVVTAVIGAGLTGGFLFAPGAAGVRISRLSVFNGLARMFGTQAWFGLGKTILKFALVTAVVSYVVIDNARTLMLLGRMDAEAALSIAGELILRNGLLVVFSFVLIAVLDAFYQRHAFAKRMRMSKQEVRDEMKDMEGRPEVRAQIRRRQRQMATSRMMDRVKDADVVITNPEHFAVALAYDPSRDGAPTLLAKGLDDIAFRIIEEARRRGVHTFEAPPLARALYFTTKLEHPIHEALYVPVAQVIAYVFGLSSLERGGVEPIRPRVDVPDSMRYSTDGTLETEESR